MHLSNVFTQGAAEHILPEGHAHLGSIIVPAGEPGLPTSGVHVQQAVRDLQETGGEQRCITVDLTLTGCGDGNVPAQQISMWFVPAGSPAGSINGFLGVVDVVDVVFQGGQATVTFDEGDLVDNAGGPAEFCEDCVVVAAAVNMGCADPVLTAANGQVSFISSDNLLFLWFWL